MGNEDKKPGERKEYRLEYRPIRPYTFPPRAEDPPPIVRDIDQVPKNYHQPPPQNESNKPIVPHPLEGSDSSQPRPRRRRRVPRPLPFTVLFVVIFMSLGGVGSAAAVLLWRFLSVDELWALGTWVAVAWLGAGFVVWFMGWVLDSLVEYFVQMVSEGTARALAELD